MSAKRVAKSFLLLYFLFLHLALGYLLWPIVQRRLAIEDVPRPVPISPLPNASPEESPPPTTPDIGTEASPTVTPERREMIIPVDGVRSDQLVDTYSAARSSGRMHDAIDIMAPEGTPVLAAVDGEIARFFDSVQGGVTIYQLSEDKHFVFYYAHLQSRADTIKPGDHVAQGTVIGYVGNTGNAGPDNYHLHFSIARITDPTHFWHGEYINPYPLLRSGAAPR